jgi:rhodanese-related sulfurtransferase
MVGIDDLEVGIERDFGHERHPPTGIASPAVTIDDLLAEARAMLPGRCPPAGLAAAVARGALVVDIRPADQRDRDGSLDGAVVVDRNVFEWRLDPASPHRLPQVRDHDVEVIVVCNEGYSSSLAAATLQRLGLHRATDLEGGFQALLASR